MKVLRPFLVATALSASLAVSVRADTTMEMPKFSGTPSGIFGALTTPGPYIYIKTQYGFARVSVADPSNPSNGQLAQVGQKFVGSQMNGGVVGMSCDCWQGGTTMDTAEAADGTSRMVSDWIAGDQGLNGEVATGNGTGISFGQQIDVDNVPLGSRVAAIALSSGKYVAYFPTQSNGSGGGVSVVDVTSPSGSPSRLHGIEPFASLPWGNGSAVLMKAGYLGGKYLLAGAVRGDKTIRIAEIDPTTGIPTEKSSIAGDPGSFASIALGTVEGRTFVFVAQNTNGLRVYEYANGALQAPFVLPGNFNEVVVRGGSLPIMFLNSVVSLAGAGETYIEAWDTNWITRANGNAGAARKGAHIRHTGAPEKFLGAYDARFVGSIAYIYRITPFGGVTESVLQTTPVDLSSLTIDPNSAPIASSSATNVSALQRVGVERSINYFGDAFEIDDTSASAPGPPANGLSQISWDWNYTGTFAPDTGWTQVPYGGNSDISPAYFPCDPKGGGNIQTGAGCAVSLGNPTSGGNYRYAVQTVNGVGSSLPAPSSPIAMVFPQIIIAGLNTSVSPALLQVLTGSGVADASGSQGNLAQATFDWTFNPGGIKFSTAKVTNFGNATSFALTITYKGGYTATQTGDIHQVDLVPDFTPTSSSVLVGGNLTITNKMQKGTGVTVNSVEYKWDSDASYTTLASAFNASNGQASVPAPPTGASHTLTLRYNYSVGSQGKQVSVSHGPFTAVLNNLAVSVSASPSSGKAGQTISFTATVTGGSASTTLEWCWQDCLGGFGSFVSGKATASHVYTTSGTKTATVRATDGVVQAYGSTTVTITGGGGGGGGNPIVNLLGPTTGVVNQSATFTASTSGGTAPYTYSWCWEACSLGGSFASGPAVNSHTYTATGSKTLSVQVRDGAGKTGTDTLTITINSTGGGGGGSLNVSISGATSGKAGQSLSFTANVSGGTAPYTYSWCWDACSLGGTFVAGPATNSHMYTTSGSHTLAVQVTDSASHVETDTQPVSISGSGGGGGTPAPSGTYTVVSGADINPFNGSYSGSVGTPITLQAIETHAATWAWDFGDGSNGSGASVTHTYASGGTFTIQLTVTGDGTNTAGSASSDKDFSISGPVFSAVAVPDAANIATSDGTWKTDVSVTNGGPTEISITPIFVTYEALNAKPSPLDVTTLGFSSASKYTIPPGGTWSQADVVGFLQGTGKGNLFIQTEGGLFPDVAARVYFEPNDPTVGTFGNSVAAFRIGMNGQVGVEAIRALNPQTIVGVRSDDQQRFKLKLYNSSGSGASFRVTAFDETGAAVPLNGAQFMDVGINAYQAPEFSGDQDLGLADPTHRYVIQAEPISQGGMLIASVSVIDRTTNDQVRLADDATRPAANTGVVTAWVPGASRFDTAAAHWRTSIAIMNSGSAARNITVDYIYGAGKTATFQQSLNPGELASFDDISQLYPNVPEIATATGTSGLLRVSYPADGEESSKPLYVNARSYDDRSSTTGGTAGTALSVYATGDAIGPSDPPLVISGIEVDDRFRTNVGLFAIDDALTLAKVTAIDKDGNVIGIVDGIALNNLNDPVKPTGPWSQFPISVLSGLPTEPFSLEVEITQGHAAAYAINVDQKSSDTTFIRATN